MKCSPTSIMPRDFLIMLPMCHMNLSFLIQIYTTIKEQDLGLEYYNNFELLFNL